MASAALLEWQGKRAKNINELLDAHQQISGTGPGRRWRTEQLNLSVMLRLAAEFQGFCRDLHDLASDEFASQAGQLNAGLSQILRSQLTTGRKLDSGNANPGNLGSDFARLGLRLWPEIEKRNAQRAPIWNKSLTALNDARNAVAHDNRAALARIAADGYRLSALLTIKNFRRDAGQVAVVMDDVVADYLQQLFGGSRPW